MVLETKMTSKGQVQIFKKFRDQLKLGKDQRFVEKTDGSRIILEPVPSLVSLGGSLSLMGKNKKIGRLIKETKEGWD